MVKFGHRRLFIEGTAPVSFHDPEIGIGSVDEGEALVDEAAIKAVHGQHYGKQQTYAENRGNEPAFVLLEVIIC
jgi:hypothetical protein